MKKNKSKKLLLWLTTGALAMGFAIAALPTSLEDEYNASAETMLGEVVGTTFSDDFSKYTSYGNALTVGGVRTNSGIGWTNEYFDGVGGSTTDYGTGCTNEYASITTDPDNTDNKVLYLNTNKDENSFFYITPTKDGKPLCLKNYEISYKFKVSKTTKSEDRRKAAPWFGTINRKTTQGDDTYQPTDGRFNGSFNMLTALRAGVDSNDSSTQSNYFFSFFQYNKMDNYQLPDLEGERTTTGERGKLDNKVYPSTIYDTWHVYTCIVNENAFDIYLDGKHMGGFDITSKANYDSIREEGYLSIALCVADIYVDDVNIKELLPEPGVKGASEISMRKDGIKDAIFNLVNTKTVVAIKNGTEALSQSAYVLSSDGKTLAINKSYIDTLAVGTHTFTVTASDGTKNYDFDITIVITPIPGVDGASNQVQVRPTEDAVITLKNVSEVKSIKKGTEIVANNQYFFVAESNKLTLKVDYVGTILGLGTHELTVDTNYGEFTLTLVVKNKPSVSGSTTAQVAQGDSASFTLKNVSSILAVTTNNAELEDGTWTYNNNVITFTGDYTATLTTGKHTYVIKTDDGDLTVNLRVKAGGTSGDDENAPSVDTTELSVKVGKDAVFTLTNVNFVNAVEADTANGSKTLVAGTDYTYADSKLTIKASCFKTLGAGVYTFVVTVNNTAELDLLTVSYYPATISGLSVKDFAKNTDGDLTFTFENVESITNVKREKYVNPDCYSFANNTLTIDASYLSSLATGAHTFKVITDNGEVSVSVNVTGAVTLKLILPDGSKASFASGEDGITTFDEGTATDVTFQVKGISKGDVIVIKVSDTKKLVSEAYSYSNGELTIKGAYIETLKAGTKELTLVVGQTGSNGGSNSSADNDKGGCGSSLGFASTMLLATTLVGGLAIARKKRK